MGFAARTPSQSALAHHYQNKPPTNLVESALTNRIFANSFLLRTYAKSRFSFLQLCSGRHHQERAVLLARWPDRNFYVLTQRGKEFHEASNGKVARAVAHQQGPLRLPYT